MKLRLTGILAMLVIGAGILVPSSASAYRIPHIEGTHPMIFVHGGSGSGGQFESQAMRFESNGYPHEYVKVLEYDSQSLYNFSTQQVNTALLEQI
jgi:triacylglycerol esterase/lipase EstA (alpha/beta hydrolase family)